MNWTLTPDQFALAWERADGDRIPYPLAVRLSARDTTERAAQMPALLAWCDRVLDADLEAALRVLARPTVRLEVYGEREFGVEDPAASVEDLSAAGVLGRDLVPGVMPGPGGGTGGHGTRGIGTGSAGTGGTGTVNAGPRGARTGGTGPRDAGPRGAETGGIGTGGIGTGGAETGGIGTGGAETGGAGPRGAGTGGARPRGAGTGGIGTGGIGTGAGPRGARTDGARTDGIGTGGIGTTVARPGGVRHAGSEPPHDAGYRHDPATTIAEEIHDGPQPVRVLGAAAGHIAVVAVQRPGRTPDRGGDIRLFIGGPRSLAARVISALPENTPGALPGLTAPLRRVREDSRDLVTVPVAGPTAPARIRRLLGRPRDGIGQIVVSTRRTDGELRPFGVLCWIDVVGDGRYAVRTGADVDITPVDAEGFTAQLRPMLNAAGRSGADAQRW